MKAELKKLAEQSNSGRIEKEKQRLTELFRKAASSGKYNCTISINEALNPDDYRSMFPDLHFGNFERFFAQDARESSGITCVVSWE